MKISEELKRENQVLRERISRLSAASLRISSSLDLGTVLQEVVDSACVLTDARYGVITTIDDKGQPQDFVSSGFTPEEQSEIGELAPTDRSSSSTSGTPWKRSESRTCPLWFGHSAILRS